MSGYVYLIGTTMFHWYKIGKSRTPEIRIKNLGILLPFKIRVIEIWKAKNHTALEFELHQIYSKNQINGEWFNFEPRDLQNFFNLLPEESKIYPTEDLTSVFSTFSNIEEDTRGGRKILGVKVQKLRGNFTPAEREIRRIESMQLQKEKKLLKQKLIPSDVKQWAPVSEPLQGESNDIPKQICISDQGQ